MIRLRSITLNGFKNVGHGEVALSTWKKGEPAPDADIVGIYGQNGSGKTSVIQALGIVKHLWSGKGIRNVAADCVSKESDEAEIVVEGVLFNNETQEADLLFVYKVTFTESSNGPSPIGEELACKDLSRKEPMRTLLSYSLKDGGHWGYELKPKQFWKDIMSLDEDAKTGLAVAQRLSADKSCSLVFSNDFFLLAGELSNKTVGKAKSNAKSKTAGGVGKTLGSASALAMLWQLITGMKLFALTDLAVVAVSQYAVSMLNHLHIATHEGELGRLADASFIVNLAEPATLNEKQLNDLRNTVEKMTPVLSALVPGLSLGVVQLGGMLGDDGTPAERVEITCTRGGTTVPLRCESEGIKKLVSILTLLIDVYSKPGACVAIDELDSGVFEFLLGEILQVLQNHGRGQLIFTAHNLRPLETLNKGSLVFTTTNPERRYIKFRGSREKSNLRSQYLRAINLGGQAETVYEPTNIFDIDGAFYDSGFPENG
ncbi:AAA domain-containing protein [Bifidobacterium lemurum]|uniref:AAA domain-containing protein n=1 Tax=Bifidobacterium lemurum TaxID=1603886 RepID=A0A261FQN0_9BIFI|nr:AAA family ATPase [Bifidobacterium lemurum]OZG61305.1 AAA domain-containing protein [Bifidobacterium lemurum]QOL34693.1 ATP-binding protein [Bifidobacterium lemurum]